MTSLERQRRTLPLDAKRFRLSHSLTLARAHPLLVSLLVTIVLMEVVHGIEMLSLFPLYLADVEHESASLVALTISVYLVVDILTRTPAGWLADRIGRKPLLLAGIALSALPLPVMMQTQDQDMFLALNAINGIGAGCIWPAIYASIADRYGKGQRGLIFGLVNTVMLGGLASGPISGGLLVGLSGSFTVSFLFCFALVACAFAIVALFARESDPAMTSQPSAVREEPRRSLRFNAQLIILFAVVLCLTLGIAVLVPILTFYGRDVLGLSPQAFALTLALPAICTAIALVPFGHWVDRYGRKRPLVIGLTVFALCLWLAPVSTAPLV
ncbi:MAG: MFS transporter, partial [Chloroflexi bacterium]|nr:MFS transporter [Chloroflexota bacterium]